jgi:hypothetical protein
MSEIILLDSDSERDDRKRKDTEGSGKERKKDTRGSRERKRGRSGSRESVRKNWDIKNRKKHANSRRTDVSKQSVCLFHALLIKQNFYQLEWNFKKIN